MRTTSQKAAAHPCRAAAFLLFLGIFLPLWIPPAGLYLSPETRTILKQTLPESIEPWRAAFVRTACGTIGRVSYFWGGKSHKLDWDLSWGWPRRVSAAGSASSGKIRAFGLDCSGLVSWAAAASSRCPDAYARVGEGVREQFSKASPTDAPKPGDLAFFPDLSHVGVVVGRDDTGTLWIVHSSASRGGVVLTDVSVGFTLFGTPHFAEIGGGDGRDSVP